MELLGWSLPPGECEVCVTAGCRWRSQLTPGRTWRPLCLGVLVHERRGGGVSAGASPSGSAAGPVSQRAQLPCPMDLASCHLYLFLQGQRRTGLAETQHREDAQRAWRRRRRSGSCSCFPFYPHQTREEWGAKNQFLTFSMSLVCLASTRPFTCHPFGLFLRFENERVDNVPPSLAL